MYCRIKMAYRIIGGRELKKESELPQATPNRPENCPASAAVIEKPSVKSGVLLEVLSPEPHGCSLSQIQPDPHPNGGISHPT